MPGYDGAYRAVVVDTSDPLGENRVQVQVPDVAGSDPMWARAEEPTASVPTIGEEVTVHFENGDEQNPLWRPGTPPATAQPAEHGRFNATYRGVVVDNVDPLGSGRVSVQVPDVSTENMWAAAETSGAALPAVGDDVSVRFQDGDVNHPMWSGGSGTGATPESSSGGGAAASLEGEHPATVISNADPGGLGRLYVQVPGVTDGVWASPEQAPPAVGESVTVKFDGSADHARWSR